MSTAIDFLKAFDPSGWHNLVAIKPDPTPGVDEPVGVTIAPGEWAKAEAFVADHEGRNNLYFSVNEPKPHAPNKKLKKTDIATIRAIYADVDPGPGDLEQARKVIRDRAEQALSTTPPNLIIDSGGGLQFFWQTDKLPVDEATQATAEKQARGIAYLMEGDGVCNIDRIMRLPGTHNIPGEKKIARGRKTALATVITHKQFTTDLSKLAKAYKPLDAPEGDDTSEEINALIHSLDMGYIKGASSYADLPADLKAKFDRDLLQDESLAQLWSGDAQPEDTSSSGWRFALAKAVKSQGGYTAEQFGALCWVWDKADPDKITPRAIARDWSRAGKGPEDWLDIMPDETPENLSKSKKFEFEEFDAVVAQDVAAAPALIDGLLDQGAMSVIYGDSNAGKTFVALDICFHIGAGIPFSGMETTRGLVVYIAAEGGQGAKKRLKALRRKFPTQSVDFLLLVSPVDLRRPGADLAPLVEALRAIGRPIALIVIDTLSRAMAGGDENSSVDMGAMVKHFDLLRKATVPAHLMVVHHTGKDKAKGARGHSLLRAATDTEIEVEGLTPGVLGGTIRVTKQRDMDGNWSSGFSGQTHVLGVKSNGRPITSCTIELVGVAVAKAVALKPTEKERAVLSGIALLRDESGEIEFSTEDVAKIVSDDLSKAGVEAVRKNMTRMVAKGFLEKRGRNKWAENSDILPLSELDFENHHTTEADKIGQETDKGIFA